MYELIDILLIFFYLLSDVARLPTGEGNHGISISCFVIIFYNVDRFDKTKPNTFI